MISKLDKQRGFITVGEGGSEVTYVLGNNPSERQRALLSLAFALLTAIANDAPLFVPPELQ